MGISQFSVFSGPPQRHPTGTAVCRLPSGEHFSKAIEIRQGERPLASTPSTSSVLRGSRLAGTCQKKPDRRVRAGPALGFLLAPSTTAPKGRVHCFRQRPPRVISAAEGWLAPNGPRPLGRPACNRDYVYSMEAATDSPAGGELQSVHRFILCKCGRINVASKLQICLKVFPLERVLRYLLVTCPKRTGRRLAAGPASQSEWMARERCAFF